MAPQYKMSYLDLWLLTLSSGANIRFVFITAKWLVCFQMNKLHWSSSQYDTSRLKCIPHSVIATTNVDRDKQRDCHYNKFPFTMCLQAHANEKSLFLKFFTCSKRRFRNYTVCDVTKGFEALPSWLFFFHLMWLTPAASYYLEAPSKMEQEAWTWYFPWRLQTVG